MLGKIMNTHLYFFILKPLSEKASVKLASGGDGGLGVGRVGGTGRNWGGERTERAVPS